MNSEEGQSYLGHKEHDRIFPFVSAAFHRISLSVYFVPGIHSTGAWGHPVNKKAVAVPQRVVV